MFLNLYHYRQYILRNAWDDLRLRYAGSSMGVVWNFLLPLLQIIIYTTIFSRLISLRSARIANDRYGFILYLCSGLLPWIAFSGSVIRGSNALLNNARYLKKLPVPEEIFVALVAVADLFGLQIYLILLVIAGLVLGQPLGWAVLLLPLAAVLFQMLAFGLGLLLSSLIVLFRDIGQLLGVILQMAMWTLPIIYVETVMPPRVQALIRWNPAYFYIKTFRDLFLDNQVPPWTTWGVMLAWAVGVSLLGYIVLRKLHLEVRDVI